MKQAILCLPLGVVALLAGCATHPTGSTVYSPSRINQTYTNYPGTVLGVKRIAIEGTKSSTGAIAGGAVGGGVGIAAAGGGGVTGAVAGGVGTAAGVVVGQEIEKMITAKPGLEITVQMQNGDVLVVVQEEDFTFRDGDQVTVQRGSGGYTRVLP